MQIAQSCVTWLAPTWYASFTCEITDKHRKRAQCVSVHSMCVTRQWIAHACATDSCMPALSSIFSTLQRTCLHYHTCSQEFLTLRVLQDQTGLTVCRIKNKFSSKIAKQKMATAMCRLVRGACSENYWQINTDIYRLHSVYIWQHISPPILLKMLNMTLFQAPGDATTPT